MTLLLRRRKGGVYDAGEVEDGGPLAVALAVPDNLAVEEVGGFGGAKVVMEVEVLCVGWGVGAAEVEEGSGGFPLGREDEGGVVFARFGGGDLHLLDGEVFDLKVVDGAAEVAEL